MRLGTRDILPLPIISAELVLSTPPFLPNKRGVSSSANRSTSKQEEYQISCQLSTPQYETLY